MSEANDKTHWPHPEWTSKAITDAPKLVEQHFKNKRRQELNHLKKATGGIATWRKIFESGWKQLYLTPIDEIMEALKVVRNDSERVIKVLNTEWRSFIWELRKDYGLKAADETYQKAKEGPSNLYLFLIQDLFRRKWTRSHDRAGFETQQSIRGKIGLSGIRLWETPKLWFNIALAHAKLSGPLKGLPKHIK